MIVFGIKNFYKEDYLNNILIEKTHKFFKKIDKYQTNQNLYIKDQILELGFFVVTVLLILQQIKNKRK